MWRIAVIAAGLAACSFEHGTAASGDAISVDMATPPEDGKPDTPLVMPMGVVARWEFDETSGTVAADTSGVGTPLDLAFVDALPTGTWAGGALHLTAETRMRSGPATKIYEACSTSDAVTVEAWIRPADNLQTGPARVLSISSDTVTRNVMLAQIGATFVSRVRTSNTDNNGTPELGTGAVIAGTPALMHVVITADSGERLIYVNGQERGKDALGGDFGSWDATLPVLVGNEEAPAVNRAWLGELHRIVVYCRRLPESEIKALHAQGL
ncbi:MAG TPA: LamG-like jellyroll fold domain-containing protein [Kofleriaceae bacterium]